MRGLMKYRSWLILVAETILIAITYYAAYDVAFDFDLTPANSLIFVQTLPLILLVKILVFKRFGLLGGWWRYAGMSEALDITHATGISSGILFGVLGLLWHIPGFHLTVLAIDACLTILVTGGARFAVRAYTEHVSENYIEPKGTLIVGAGRMGSAIARDLREHPELNYKPIGFADDDRSKLGIRIHGVPVVGTTHDLGQLLTAYGVHCVVIAIRNTPGALMQRVIEQCRAHKLEFKIVPPIAERMNGSAFALLRKISPDDLLGRMPVKLDLDPIRARLENKVVLITGAGGSIGSELARQVARFNPPTFCCSIAQRMTCSVLALNCLAISRR